MATDAATVAGLRWIRQSASGEDRISGLYGSSRSTDRGCPLDRRDLIAALLTIGHSSLRCKSDYIEYCRSRDRFAPSGRLIWQMRTRLVMASTASSKGSVRPYIRFQFRLARLVALLHDLQLALFRSLRHRVTQLSLPVEN